MTVWYDDLTAFDPKAGRVADTAIVELFDYSDTSFTAPLTITDGAGLSANKRIVSNGAVPGFNGPDGGQVWAKSGTWVTLWRSFSGMQTATEQARDAAQQAADTVAGAVAGAVFGVVAGTNVTVDNADPQHPIVSATGGGGGGTGTVDTVVAGTNVTIDDTDPANPVINVDAPALADVDGLQAALDGKANSTHQHTVSQISDSTTVGRDVVKAASQAAARSAIGAGQVNSVAAGTNVTVDNTDPTAPVINVDGSVVGGDWETMANMPDFVAAGDTSADARSAIGAGTSSFDGNYNNLTNKPTIPTLSAATATASGVVELATTAETTAGTDTARAVTPAGVAAALNAAPLSLAQQQAIDAASSASNRTMYGSGWPTTRPEGTEGQPREWDDTALAVSTGADTTGPEAAVLVDGDYWTTYRFEALG